MYKILYSSHSGLRYLVLLAGLIAFGYALYAILGKKPWSKAGRILGSSFLGLLDLQIVLGVVMLNWTYYPALIGHFAMMLLGAGVGHGVLVVNRKRPQPSWVLLLVAVGVALGCILGGIMAIGRTPFEMRRLS